MLGTRVITIFTAQLQIAALLFLQASGQSCVSWDTSHNSPAPQPDSVVKYMVALHIPIRLGALLVMLLVAETMGTGLYAVVAPATEWMEKAPLELRQLEYKLAWAKKPIEQINEVRRRSANSRESKGVPMTGLANPGSPRSACSIRC